MVEFVNVEFVYRCAFLVMLAIDASEFGNANGKRILIPTRQDWQRHKFANMAGLVEEDLLRDVLHCKTIRDVIIGHRIE